MNVWNIFTRPIDDDLDGEEMSDGDSKSDLSYGTPRQQTGEMTEERRKKLREIEVSDLMFSI